MNEYRLPVSKRSTKVKLVRLESAGFQHSCPPGTIHSQLHLAGISLWPKFTVANQDSQPVVRKSQSTGTLAGGYLFDNDLVGTRHFTDVTSCAVACQAMLYTYGRINTTMIELNSYLQQNKGYSATNVAKLTTVSPSGDVVWYTALTRDTPLKVGDFFVVEHPKGYYSPLAVYMVTESTVMPQGQIHGKAIRQKTYNTTLPTNNDVGRVYWQIIPGVADGITTGRLHTVPIDRSPQIASRAESLLVRNIPVAVNVEGHWVVADGWTFSIDPDGTSQGTYSIKDPFDERNFTKLNQRNHKKDYKNCFKLARYVLPGGPGLAPETGPAGLSIIADGAGRVEVIDPLGRRILEDHETGYGVYQIPGSSIEEVFSEHDNGGEDDPPTGYVIDIPNAVSGTYVFGASANNGLSVSASGYSLSGIFDASADGDTALGAIGRLYSIEYSAAGQSVILKRMGGLGIEATPTNRPPLISVRQNPTRGLIEFVLSSQVADADVIEIFDVSGRLVDVVNTRDHSGERNATWDWRKSGAVPGIYFGRLRFKGHEVTARFAVLK